MAFELFNKKGIKGIEAFATINKNNVLSLNAQAIEIYDLKEYNYANIYYDEETKKVGLKFIQDKEKGSFILTKSNHRHAIYVSLTAFLKFYRLQLNKPRKYLMIKDEESGLCVFDMNNPLKVQVHKKRKKDEV